MKYTIWYRIKGRKTFYKFGEYIEAESKEAAYNRCHDGVAKCVGIAFDAPMEELIIKKKRNQNA